MIHKTRGIVIHTMKYTDNSVISHIYTEHFGRQSFLVNGTRGKKSSSRINLLQHLSLLDMEVYIKQSRDLQRIREIRLYENFGAIPYDPVKNAVALFISEILYRTLHEQEANHPLFSYLINSVRILDLAEEGFASFHLIFMVGLARYLGFAPKNNYSDSRQFFDICNAEFTAEKPLHQWFIAPESARYLSEVMGCSFDDMKRLKYNSKTRNILVSSILDYYRYHIQSMGEVKSFSVLREIF
jgi:DNA repair protein RecO (recombination protein O)